MSTMESEEWGDDFDDDDDEDEEEFVPDVDDEEEGDDCIDYDDNYKHSESFPSILQGDLYFDKSKGLCYEKEGTFCLVCKTRIPGGTFSFQEPLLDNPLSFGGWVNDPCQWSEFNVTFSKEPMSTDPLELQLMAAQEEHQCKIGMSAARGKTGDESDENIRHNDSYIDEKKCSPKSRSKGQVHLKNDVCVRKPPPSDFKIDSSSIRSDSKQPASKGHDEMIVVSGIQTGGDKIQKSIAMFRGSFRPVLQNSSDGIHIICSTQIIDAGSTSSSGKGVISASTASTASASKKRMRSAREDDESVEGNPSVAYQELIDLHDDTRLSTEELRRKYYGFGATKGNDFKLLSSEKKRKKSANHSGKAKREEEHDDDDDDDAYGF